MSEKSESQLSDEFKKDIKEKRKNNNNLLGTLIALMAIVLVFGTVGVAGYQMLSGSSDTDTKSVSEKIESRPAEDVVEESKEEKKDTTPEATTTTPVETKVTDTSYTVVSGDTWSSIANANGITSADLMEYNGTTSEDLQIGQVIKISK